MRKVVFKGVINDKEFDNVQDYNESMSNLIAQGATNINASSETKIIDEPDVNVNKEDVRLVKEVNPVKKKEFSVNDYCPYNNDDNDYYLDYLVSPDKDLNDKNRVRVEENLKNVFEKLHHDLGTGAVSFNDAFDLLNNLKEIRACINNDSNDNDDVIDQLTKSIERDTERLELLKYSKPFIGLMLDYYDSAFNLVKDYILKY